jgi:hypothetical protein
MRYPFKENMMDPDQHELIHDFPEYRDKILTLKNDNAHFAKLFDEYQDATHEVERLEIEGIPMGDVSFEELKKKRIKLKDELYAMLVA